jgi:excisionase family DNA binding protein
MARREFDAAAPFQGIKGAARATGLSQGYVRQLCREGRAPFIKVGGEYRVNVPGLLRLLEGESVANLRREINE